jgi:hypothetical protein
MGDTNGGKFERHLYNLNKVRAKSGDKYKKAHETYLNILKKEVKAGGETKWTIDAKQKATARLKKLGIALSTVKAYAEKKGLTDLASKIPA